MTDEPHSEASLPNCHWRGLPGAFWTSGTFLFIWGFLPLFSKCWQKQISDEGRATVASSLDFSPCVNVFVSEPLWLQRAFSVAPFKWPCSYLHKLATVCLLFQPNQLVRGLHCFCLVRGGGKVDCVTALLQQRALCLTACSPGRLNVHHDAVVVLSVMETFQQQIKKQKQSSHN